MSMIERAMSTTKKISVPVTFTAAITGIAIILSGCQKSKPNLEQAQQSGDTSNPDGLNNGNLINGSNDPEKRGDETSQITKRDHSTEQSKDQALQSPTGGLTQPANSAASLSGQPGAQEQAGKPADRQVAEAPKAPDPNCFQWTYSHSPEHSHKSKSQCANHRNKIVLPHTEKELKDVKACVKIDGKAVPFQKSGNAIQFNALAGPQAQIQVSYCFGKTQCETPCVIPKDEFLEALGADDDSAITDNAELAKVDGELKKELEDESDLAVFTGWKLGQETAKFCENTGRQIASKK